MIAIKSELGILADENYSALPCSVKVENDEIYILDANDDLFSYNRKDPQSLLIQKAIFHEKETVIENCLFGVDINPNSVNICRLRLWIELLKNAYYTDEGELQTLPNIDINIKNGNSLISRFALDDSLKAAFKNKEIGFSVADYKQAVKDYKTTNSKSKKREVEDIINIIKNNFKSTLDNSIKEKVSKALGLFQNEEQRQQNLLTFGEAIKKTEKDNLKKLKQRAELAQKEKEEILNNVIYRNAFEWRFEFPEVLDGEGNFLGFDVIIGNPPYIQLQKMGAASDALQKIGYQTFAKTGDIYSLFYELGNNVLKSKGFLTYITSNKWMRAAYGESLRKFFVEKTNPEILIDFGGTQIFDTATVDTNILMFSKDKNRQQTQVCIIKDKVLNNLSDYFRQNGNYSIFSKSESWVILSPIESTIKTKMEEVGIPLKKWDIRINYGIKTGYNDAFIITSEQRSQLIKSDPKSAEIIRPILRGRDIKKYECDFADQWIINVHNGIKEKGIKPIDINDFPAVKKHLDMYYNELAKRSDKGDSLYNLRNCAYMEDFYKQKIVWKIIGDQMAFFIDSNNFIVNNACYILTGESLEYLLLFLNSKIIKWYSYLTNMNKTGVGDMQVGAQNLVLFPIPIFQPDNDKEFISLLNEILKKKKDQQEISDLENIANKLVYRKYGLTQEEIDFIDF